MNSPTGLGKTNDESPSFDVHLLLRDNMPNKWVKDTK
jgi:hypothetical protein